MTSFFPLEYYIIIIAGGALVWLLDRAKGIFK